MTLKTAMDHDSNLTLIWNTETFEVIVSDGSHVSAMTFSEADVYDSHVLSLSASKRFADEIWSNGNPMWVNSNGKIKFIKVLRTLCTREPVRVVTIEIADYGSREIAESRLRNLAEYQGLSVIRGE